VSGSLLAWLVAKAAHGAGAFLGQHATWQVCPPQRAPARSLGWHRAARRAEKIEQVSDTLDEAPSGDYPLTTVAVVVVDNDANSGTYASMSPT
jgi:hypothetical protein